MITIPKDMSKKQKRIWYNNLTIDEKKEANAIIAPELIKSSKYYDLVQRLTLVDLDNIKPSELQHTHTGDCTIKSVSCLLDQEYTQTYKEVFELAMQGYYMPNDSQHVIYPYIAKYGWMNQTKFADGKKVDVGEIISKYEDAELLICNTRYKEKPGSTCGHMFGYKNHTIYNYRTMISGLTDAVQNDQMVLTILMETNCYMFFMKTKGL